MNILNPGKLLLSMVLAVGVAGLLMADGPPAKEFQANWPRFRGPEGNGFTQQKGFPLSFNVQSGENVAWSVPVPMAGFSSPVVWGNRVFLSGGDEKKCEVMAFDVATGKLLWESTVPKTAGSPDERPKVPDECGMAAGTVATDGQRVYAMFADGDIAAFDFDGKVAWAKYLGFPKNQYGFATSLLTWQGRVIVQFDQGDPEDKASKLLALDGATGKVVWERERPVGASWATPIVFDAAGKTQIVTCAVPLVISYAAKDGAELWRAEGLDGEVTPSPIFANGTVFAVSPANKLQTIRPDGEGDVTGSHLGWVAEDGIPAVTSPVSDGELVFLVDAGGMMTCYDAKTGRKQWEHDLGDECNASPSIAGGKLYVISIKGVMTVAGTLRQYGEVSQSSFGEKVLATPAFAQGKIFVRGMTHLFCLGGK